MKRIAKSGWMMMDEAASKRPFGPPMVPHVGFPCNPMVPFGSFGMPFWLLWDALGLLWVPLGRLGVPWGAFLEFDVYWTSLSEQMGSKYAACHQKRASRNSWDTAHSEHTDTLSTQEVLLRAPLLHAPGARMTVVELTPSK